MATGISFWLALTAATLSAGESGALLIGMRDAAGPAPWMTGANVAYAVSDIALGLAVGACALAGKGGSWYAQATLAALALTCGTRAIEYAAGTPHAFCANGPLVAVDLAKLVLVAAALATVWAGK